MPEVSSSFTDLMCRVREGSKEALCELVQKYEHHILRAVRRQMSKRLRAKFDSLDFRQAVWASFFAHVSQIGQFTNPEELMAFLTAMARHKVVTEFRKRLVTQKHNINRERSLESAGGQALVAAQPTPSQVAIADERLTQLLRNQPAHYQQMVVLRSKGNSSKEIAERLGVNEKTVRRVLDKLAAKHLT